MKSYSQRKKYIFVIILCFNPTITKRPCRSKTSANPSHSKSRPTSDSSAEGTSINNISILVLEENEPRYPVYSRSRHDYLSRLISSINTNVWINFITYNISLYKIKHWYGTKIINIPRIIHTKKDKVLWQTNWEGGEILLKLGINL